jgi:hypothetical protein
MSVEIAYPYRMVVSGAAVRFEAPEEDVIFSPVNADSVRPISDKLDGARTVDELREKYPKFGRDIAELLDLAVREKVVFDRTRLPSTISGTNLLAAVEKHIPSWNERLFNHQLWRGLYQGKFGQTVARGWSIETYFFIRGAIMRMPSVISACRVPEIREIFLEHFTEEYDHYAFFATALERQGVDVGKIERRGPLPSTEAVINFTKYASRIHPLCYSVCSGLLESTGTDAHKGRDFYRHVAEHYDMARTGWVEPMLKHVDLDESYGHGSVMKEIFEQVPHVDRQVADEIFQTAELFVETLILWFDEIVWFYRNREKDECNLVYRLYA